MEIYLLLQITTDAFGDAPVAWEPISWTDDLQTAIKWREESHLYGRKDFKRIPKHPAPLEKL